MKKAELDLSIIIPTYKEEGRIGKTLEELAGYIKAHKYKTEVLVVDAGSPTEPVVLVNRRRNQGKTVYQFSLRGCWP